MQLAGELYIGEDNLVEWIGLYDNALKEYVNDATVTFELKPVAGGAAVESGSMSYVEDSNGKYRGTIEDDTSLTDGTEYFLEVTASASGDRIGFRKVRYKAKYHDFQ